MQPAGNNHAALEQGAVFHYLSRQGYVQSPAFFQQTGYRLGWEFSTQLYTMSWRQQDNCLLVCHIQALPGRQGLESAVTALIRLWRELLARVSEIDEIRGMIGRYGSPEARRRRNKMQTLLLRHGGVLLENNHEDSWLVFRR
ncbi:hypothetical protein MUA02_01150 [Enterobacteriaceae bacterium H20N1]|uniref:Uncharacterized protein n=1 Tax=Dryocola boscaweniae TaxID=2925397 RepID=A0A9X2W758_9ENTR|nr:hypothetical protein [Dryocola boscaweniae]MCT4700514.1 hypothetical protein [Dryocola boscaweniae]MCT4717670.1 hypothetical protein [Dryocola boscaweniae]